MGYVEDLETLIADAKQTMSCALECLEVDNNPGLWLQILRQQLERLEDYFQDAEKVVSYVDTPSWLKDGPSEP